MSGTDIDEPDEKITRNDDGSVGVEDEYAYAKIGQFTRHYLWVF